MMDELALAIRMQSLDRKIASLEHEIATLPKQIAEIERRLESHKRRLEVDKAALSGNQQQRKRIEGDVQISEQKISKLRDQMLQAKTNEQYRAFQNEIAYCEKEIRGFEDKILELMEEAERLDSNVKAASQQLAQQSETVEKEKARAREQIAASKKSHDEAVAERNAVKSKMSPALYADYERIRKKTKGTVVAEAVDGRCDACMITLRPQFLQELKLGQKIMYCESCGRILMYNPPVAMENNIGPAATTA
ncbi:MAG TPA: C4-type zinc ribbon domain-containing protein [Bryobacteraceae bacterium]|jgi:predicted  nucleic acid-binding Zn-ribbon protein